MQKREHHHLQRRSADAALTAKAYLLLLSGDHRGTILTVYDDSLSMIVDRGDVFLVDPETAGGNRRARISRNRSGYEITRLGRHEIWVNGHCKHRCRLEDGDLIELEHDRLVLCFQTPATATNPCANDDNIPTRVHQPISRSFNLTRAWAASLALLLAMAIIGTLASLWHNRSIQAKVASSEAQVLKLSESFTEVERQVLSRTDFETTNADLWRSLDATNGRVQNLESNILRRAAVITNSLRSIVFLQGAYVFTHPESGMKLRYFVNTNTGEPYRYPTGEPVLTLSGDGPVATMLFTGTGFVVSADGRLLTNRHIALPWEEDESYPALAKMLGLVPTYHRFIGYLPGQDDAFDVETLAVSANADLAILQSTKPLENAVPLQLSTSPPPLGQEVIVMGYPTGLRALLIRTDNELRAELEGTGEVDWWQLTARLAKAGHIRPLTSRGIVAQSSFSALVYDAQTTKGGSGSPVLTMDGKVVAITSVILEDFGGSNMGVPARYGTRLLVENSSPVVVASVSGDRLHANP